MQQSYSLVLPPLFFLLLLPSPTPAQTASEPKPNQDVKPGILVELFTSEGCSSCPPADALLRQLDSQRSRSTAEIVVLGEHVDYWDGTGWRDRFSSREYTERQEDYARKFHIAGPYTPQMVIDGRTEFVGNDSSALQSALNQAASQPKATVAISAEVVNATELKLHIETSALPKSSKHADLYVALADNQDDTQIGGGENSGRSLHHAAALRSLRKVAAVGADAEKYDITLALSKTQKLENTRVVAFIQESNNGNVLGAAVRIVGSSPATR